jgi:ceramide glucosyltransferase
MDTVPRSIALYLAGVMIAVRTCIAAVLAIRLTQSREVLGYWWLTSMKDSLQFAIWAASFLGNTVEWRGQRFRILRGGRIAALESPHGIATTTRLPTPSQ